MGAPRHPPERRAEAIAALYASAAVDGDDILPHFRAVERQLKLDSKVLIRWWAQRDKNFDAAERRKAVSRAAAAAVRGAEGWGNLVQDGLRKVGQRATELLNDDDRFNKAKYDEGARGLKALGETLKVVDSALKGLQEQADRPQTTGDLDATVRAAMEKDLPQGAGGPQEKTS